MLASAHNIVAFPVSFDAFQRNMQFPKQLKLRELLSLTKNTPTCSSRKAATNLKIAFNNRITPRADEVSKEMSKPLREYSGLQE